MHRFYARDCQEPVITLTGTEAHHALHVLRVRAGERLSLLDGAGTQCDCIVDRASKNELTVRVSQRHTAPPPACHITLIQAVPKGKLFDTVIQKAVELGACAVVPLLSERVVKHFDPTDAARFAQKWQQVAIEAIKQCGAPWLPQIALPVKLTDYLAKRPSFDLSLVGALIGERRHPRHYFEEFCRHHNRTPASAAVWIGPEGDFSPGELDLILSSGALPITMGELVLRTDTASLYALSVLNYELQYQARPDSPTATPLP